MILTALKRYGMILADNGSPWYITGAPDPRWNDDDLHGLGGITGAMFEVVDTTADSSHGWGAERQGAHAAARPKTLGSQPPASRTSSIHARSRPIVVAAP